jgi:putative ABC transport system permease protein
VSDKAATAGTRLAPRWLKMLRDMWQHKARTLLVMLAIAVGMTAAGALLNAWALVQHVTESSYRTSEPVSATLVVEGVGPQLLAEVRAMPDIAAARIRRAVVAAAHVNGARATALLYALDDFARVDINRLQPEIGEWPPADGHMIIERSSLVYAGASVGQPIMLSFGSGSAIPVDVTGIVRDVSLAPGWMDHVVYGFVTPATLEKLGAPSAFNELQIRVRDTSANRDAVRRIAYDVKTLAERAGLKVTNVDVPVPGQHMHAAQMDSLMLTQGAFGVLTLLVCGFLIVNLIAAMLAGQVREIGVMKSLGASSRQLAAMYLGMALLLGLAAALIALPASIAIGRAYAALKADLLNFSIDGYAIPWWAIALQIAVGMALPVAAAAIPVLRGCRLSVSAALRDTGIAANGAGTRRQRTPGIGRIGRPLLLSIGNAFRRRQRLVLTLLALAAGGAVFLGAANLRTAVRASVDGLFASQHFDAQLRLSEAHTAAQLEQTAASVDGVQGAEAWATARATVARDDGILGNAFGLIAPPAGTTLFSPPSPESGRWLGQSAHNEIVVSRVLLRDEPALVVGATIPLMIDGNVSPWNIVGIVDAGAQPIAYTSRAALAGLRASETAQTLVVALTSRSTAGQLDTIARLRSVLADAGMPVASSQRLSENRRVIEDHLLMVVEFLGVMGWVMIAVGGMGLASTMSLAVLERTREIGVLRAIGARHRDIVTMLQVEGIVIALLGWLVSIPLSVPMSIVLERAFGKIMFEVPTSVVPDGSGVVQWLMLVVVVALLACALPALRATRTSTAAALSYE